jgi:DUF1680 family protein
VAILDFARQIAARFEAAGGPQLATSLRTGRGVHETANAKAYEMLSCLAGLVDLARLTGEARDDESALRAVEPALLAFDDVVARQLYVTGGLSFEEFFRAPGTAPSVGDVSETCALVSWMQLCAGLFEFTGERRFLEPFERALWNHLLAAQRDDGAAFGYFTPLAGPRHCRDDVHCCGSSGPRGLALAPQLLFSVQESVKESDAKRSTPRVEVNLLCDARLRTRVGGGAVEVALATRFPKAGVDGAKWSVAIEAKSGGAVELAVAVPSWAPRATLRGATIVGGATSAKSGASIVASLAANGTASFELDLEGVAVRRVEGHGRESGRVAFEHGPFVLARPHGGGELVPFHGTSDPADPLAVWQEATA